MPLNKTSANQKIDQYAHIIYLIKILAIKCYFWPISACFRLTRPIFLKIRQNLTIFSFNSFLCASVCSVSNSGLLALICDLQNQFLWNHQNPITFCPYFYEFNSFIHVWYIKNWENFSICSNFEWFEKSFVKSQLFFAYSHSPHHQ